MRLSRLRPGRPPRLAPKTTMRERGACGAAGMVGAATRAPAARQWARRLNRMTLLLKTTTCAGGDVSTALVSYFRKRFERLQAVQGEGVHAAAEKGGVTAEA
jgi:hypothetical protein